MGGGSGGSSGKVDFPTYLKQVHANWLATTDVECTRIDIIDRSITQIMNQALNNSPFEGLSAYSPTTELAAMDSAIDDLYDLIPTLDGISVWSSCFDLALETIDDNLLSDSNLEDEISAFNDELDAEFESATIPRFERGMQDINAVVSSSFVIGKSLIEGDIIRQKARFAAQLRLANSKDRLMSVLAATSDIAKLVDAQVSMKLAITQSFIEEKRIKLVARKEEAGENLTIDEKDGEWNLKVFSYGGNLLAAISGGTGPLGDQKPGAIQSAIGGALSGAAMGGSTGNPYVAVAGGIGGALMGLFGS